MKLVWCPERASKAYIDTVKAADQRRVAEDGTEAELVAAMAGGWNAQLIVEAWQSGGGALTSLGLSAAAQHTCGRHLCVLPNQGSAEEFVKTVRSDAAEVIICEAEEVMREMEGVDFVVVDCRRRDAARIVREARPGMKGMVVVCRSAGCERGRTADAAVEAAVSGGRRLVRSVYLPLGSGVLILQVGMGKGPSVSCGGNDGRRWISHVDRRTGEEHVFRRR